ncbi:MAG: type II toxin-antitoxin system VapB family antitoxin [Acidobacteriia bacterium]|nr:type II toxin-antitoxin system VapB family antitoxin [Terriglobia bacterium]
MRTTIRLDDQLLAQAKKLAAERGTTLTAIIEDSLREVLARRQPPRRHAKFHFPTFKGDGLQPGVDLDDSASLLDLMGERDATD